MFGVGDLLHGGLAPLKLLVLRTLGWLAGRPAVVRERTQAGSTSVVRHNERLFAATESFLPFEVEVSREEVVPLDFTTLGGMLEQEEGPKDGTFSAHPRLDPATNQLYFFSANVGPGALPRVAFGALHANGTKDRWWLLILSYTRPQVFPPGRALSTLRVLP